MNIVIGFLLLIISTLLGLIFSNKYVEKYKFYKDFYSFNCLLKNEISFNKGTINGIIDKKSEEKGLFYKNLNCFFIENKSIEKIKYISNDENDFYMTYINSIGKSDSNSQITIINSANDYLLNKTKDYEKESVSKRKLYIKLFFLVGLMLFVIVL